jgi:hypothetical protein
MRKGCLVCGIFVFALCGWPGSGGSGTALGDENIGAALRAMTGTRTRIVWVRSSGGVGSPFGPASAPCSLMALDTDENRGQERPLISQQGAFRAPTITPTGSRVLWGEGKEVWIANWDGKNRRKLLEASFLIGVAENPPGTEWVYVDDGTRIRVSDTDQIACVVRYQIDNLSRKPEVVWNKTGCSEPWQLTRDGKLGASGLPWPNVGSAHLPNGDFKIVGVDCTAGMAGDGSLVLFLNPMGHGGITVCNLDGSAKRYIDIRNTCPGREGIGDPQFWWTHFAAYDKRFFTFSGPYPSLSYRGNKTHIYFCQFNANLDGVAQWQIVSTSPECQFHPYAWLAPPGYSDSDIPSIAAGLEARSLGLFVKRLGQPGAAVKPILDELRRLAQDAKEPDKAGEAQAIIAHVEAWAKSETGRAKALEARNPAQAEKAYKNLVSRFAGLDAAATAQERLQDKQFQNDLRSWALVDRIQAAEKRLKDVPGAPRTAKDPKFAKMNSLTLGQIKTAALALGQQGASPWIIDEANAVLDRCGLEKLAKPAAAPAPTPTAGA